MSNLPTQPAGNGYVGVAVVAGEIRRLWFQARSEVDARETCRLLDIGYEGPAVAPATSQLLPVALDEKAAKQALGGVSRATLYRMLVRGDITRLPGSRRLLVTRSSIERLAR